MSFVGLSTYSSAAAAVTSTRPTPAKDPVKRPARPNLTPIQTNLNLPRTRLAVGRLEKVLPDRKLVSTLVPFYSQFGDISSPTWQKVGCGIASVAMLIDYYRDESRLDVDSLLSEGIRNGAYDDTAGWSHAGLIALAKSYGLTGESHSLAHLDASAAFAELESVLLAGPVMASVHYTFEPTNPIPHLVVVTKVEGDRVYFNDPAESAGNSSIPTKKFMAAWKQRYIEIRPQS